MYFFVSVRNQERLEEVRQIYLCKSYFTKKLFFSFNYNSHLLLLVEGLTPRLIAY